MRIFIKSNAILKTTVVAAVLLANINLVLAQRISDTSQFINTKTKNSVASQQRPYVILISADGFRHDYVKKYGATHLSDFGKDGATAASMIPSYPSVTFPNHYSIATGLYPSHHGLVNNSFYDKQLNARYSMGAKDKVRDGKWYGGTPIWVLAEQQQLLAANMFWVGSEASIKNTTATYYYHFNEKISVDQRIQAVKDWLSLPEKRRPHLITFYVSEPDHAGHKYGPEAPETANAVKMVDSVIYKLTEQIKPLGLPVNYIFVSDHGMTAVNRDNPIATPKSIDTAKYIIASSGTLMDIHAKDKKDISALYKELKANENGYKAYLKSEMPKHLHYGSEDDRMNRIGDILLIPEWPRVFSNRKPGIGHHGFDPSLVKDMHASFIAWGPNINNGIILSSFENVHIYPLIANLLGLKIQEPIDGKTEVLKPILKTK